MALYTRRFATTSTLFSRLPRTHAHTHSTRLFSTVSYEDVPPDKYAVFVAGPVLPYCLKNYGDYGTIYRRLFNDPKRDEQWDVYNVYENQFPSRAELREYKGIIITGSKFRVHEKPSFLDTLAETVREIHANGNQRLIGVGFGGQVIGHAFGGEVGPAKCGWIVGLKEQRFNKYFFKMFKDPKYKRKSIYIGVLHRDQVLKLPEPAQLFSSYPDCKNGMFSIGDNIIAVQSRPDFDAPLLKNIVSNYGEKDLLSDKLVQIGHLSLGRRPNGTYLAGVLKLFLKGEEAKNAERPR